MYTKVDIKHQVAYFFGTRCSTFVLSCFSFIKHKLEV